MDNPRLTIKDMQLLKGAIRRAFSRSELRKTILLKNRIDHSDLDRPRVKKWSYCAECGSVMPEYLMQIDHIEPLQPVGVELVNMTMDDLVNRAWCQETNLQVLCKPCHNIKSKLENAERRRLKKEKTVK